jgi:hypothetical protein
VLIRRRFKFLVHFKTSQNGFTLRTLAGAVLHEMRCSDAWHRCTRQTWTWEAAERSARGSPEATMSGFYKRLLRPSEEGAQSVTGDMSNPVSKKIVEVGISNSISTQSGGSKCGPDAANEKTRIARASSFSTRHFPSLESRLITASLVALSTNLQLADRKLERRIEAW